MTYHVCWYAYGQTHVHGDVSGTGVRGVLSQNENGGPFVIAPLE